MNKTPAKAIEPNNYTTTKTPWLVIPAVLFSYPPMLLQAQEYTVLKVQPTFLVVTLVESEVVVGESLRSKTDAILFSFHANQWKRERGATSSVAQMAMHESYQRIVGMGKRALPFIFESLAVEKDAPDHWFWALHCITGAEPVPEDDHGDLVAMAKAWLAWGKEQGYVG